MCVCVFFLEHLHNVVLCVGGVGCLLSYGIVHLQSDVTNLQSVRARSTGSGSTTHWEWSLERR
jgi:hypothetical protein